MTYNVFSGTLNPTQSINLSACPLRHERPACAIYPIWAS